MPEVEVRPLCADDVTAGQQVSARAFQALDLAEGRPGPEQTAELVERGRARIAHLLRTDPAGAWTALVDGQPAGIALALRRGPMWFLSLLTVDPAWQSAGLGRRLLAAALMTAEGAASAWLLSSGDARALRSYRRAGFALHPGYRAHGPLDRALLTAVDGVQPASYAERADLLEFVLIHQRGAAATPDLAHLAARPVPLMVTDGPHGQGFVLLRKGSISWLAATTVEAGRRLLWTALAEAGAEVEVDWLTADQQWAIEVCLDAGLSLLPGDSVCTRGRSGPLSPYLPNGAFG